MGDEILERRSTEELDRDKFFIEKLSQPLFLEIVNLKEFPLFIGLYSRRQGDEEALDYLKTCLEKKFAFARTSGMISEAPIVKISSSPIVPYNFDLGYYLDNLKMPKGGEAIPERGKEVYYPRKVENKVLGYILNGTAIDHIPAGNVWRLIEPLRLKNLEQSVSIGTNCNSKKLGKKDVLKIQGKELTRQERELVSAYVGKCTISLIRTGEVYSKSKVKTPEVLEGILLCPCNDCSGNKVFYSFLRERFVCGSCGYDFGRDELRAAI